MGCATLASAARSAVRGERRNQAVVVTEQSPTAGLLVSNLQRPAQMASRPLNGFAVIRVGPRNSTALRSKAPQEDFTQVSRGRTEGREAAKVRARHLWVKTRHAEFILGLSKDFECRSTENLAHAHSDAF